MGKNVLYEFVPCERGNFMLIAFLSQETALYFYEGGLITMLNPDRK